MGVICVRIVHIGVVVCFLLCIEVSVSWRKMASYFWTLGDGMKTGMILRVLLALLVGLGSAAVVLGCGDDDSAGVKDLGPPVDQEANNEEEPGRHDPDDGFVEEREEFLVREVAATDRYVFVPNSAPGSSTVAMIDGEDFSIVPFRVGLEPTEIRAVMLEDVGSVAYVLCEGSAALAIIRADLSSVDAMSGLVERGDVRLLKIPREVNALAMSPDGRHVLAYIDPDRPLRAEASVASLQTMALIRLGDVAGEDRVFELSVTRLISSIQFSADGSEAFVLGREGVNRIVLGAVEEDAFVAPLALNLSDEVFPPGDQQIAVSADGSFMVVRTSQFAGIALYRFETEGSEAELEVIALSAIPTDLKLVERGGARRVLAALRGSEEVALLDVDAFFAGGGVESALRVVAVEGAEAGLVQVTPDDARALVYSSVTRAPLLGVIDLESEVTRFFQMRNQIRSVAISRDSEKAIVVHRKQAGSAGAGADSQAVFQHSHGMTILDLASGYARALVLQGEPTDVVLTQASGGLSVVYALLESGDANHQGVVRIDLGSFRSDFVRLPRKPVQIGQVAGKIFVQQEAPTGRITFFDIETQSQRTVSGYELNAGIDR